MKTLYESILSKSGVGFGKKLKSICSDPHDKYPELNKLWKELGLGFDAGAGEGEWSASPHGDFQQYRIQIPERDKSVLLPFSKSTLLAFIGKDLEGDIIIEYHFKTIKQASIKKWAEKLARFFNMNMKIDSNYIYLNF